MEKLNQISRISRNNIYKILFITILLIIFVNLVSRSNKQARKYKTIINYLNQQQSYDTAEANVKLVDLRANLEPKEIYDNITCRKSSHIVVSTTLCVHSPTIDKWVSGLIMKEGVFERDHTGNLN